MKTTKKIIKVGVVGCGYWGPNLIRNLRHSPDCQLKVICDMSEQRLRHMRRLHQDVATTNRFEDVLKDPEIDAVVIATPNHWHSLIGIWACQAGKDVYIEKPVSHHLWEGRMLVEAARKRGAELGIGNADYRVLDAQAMDAEDASFDGILCRWGFMLMPDPAAALRECRRVLKPGGRLVFAWTGDRVRTAVLNIP